MESFIAYYERKKDLEEKESRVIPKRVPKYEIGQEVEANWAGGRISKHIITDIEDTVHGFWYSWIEDNGFVNGLHEKYLYSSKTSKAWKDRWLSI